MFTMKLYAHITRFHKVLGVYRNHPVRFAQMSHKPNSSLIVEPLLMKLYWVAVYDLRMYTKEDNLDQKGIKRDN